MEKIESMRNLQVNIPIYYKNQQGYLLIKIRWKPFTHINCFFKQAKLQS